MKWQFGSQDSAASEVEIEEEGFAPQRITTFEVDEEAEKLLDLKTTIHRKLLDRINLSLLERMSREQIEEEIGDIILALLLEEDAALNGAERKRLTGEVLD